MIRWKTREMLDLLTSRDSGHPGLLLHLLDRLQLGSLAASSGLVLSAVGAGGVCSRTSFVIFLVLVMIVVCKTQAEERQTVSARRGRRAASRYKYSQDCVNDGNYIVRSTTVCISTQNDLLICSSHLPSFVLRWAMFSTSKCM